MSAKKKEYKTRLHKVIMNSKHSNGKRVTITEFIEHFRKEGIGSESTISKHVYGERNFDLYYAEKYAEYLSQFNPDVVSAEYLLYIDEMADNSQIIVKGNDYQPHYNYSKMIEFIEEFTNSKMIFKYVFLVFSDENKKRMSDYVKLQYAKKIKQEDMNPYSKKAYQRMIDSGIPNEHLYCETLFECISDFNIYTPICKVAILTGNKRVRYPKILITGVNVMGIDFTFGEFYEFINHFYSIILHYFANIKSTHVITSNMKHSDDFVKRVRRGLNKIDLNDSEYKEKIEDLTYNEIEFVSDDE